MYKLPPSDFAYLYEECRRCYWLKTKGILTRPAGIFPAVFGAINTRVQGELVGKDLRELSTVLPQGIVESQERFVESTPFPGTNLFISGKYDILVKLSDGTYMVIDFKLSKPGEEKVQNINHNSGHINLHLTIPTAFARTLLANHRQLV